MPSPQHIFCVTAYTSVWRVPFTVSRQGNLKQQLEWPTEITNENTNDEKNEETYIDKSNRIK